MHISLCNYKFQTPFRSSINMSIFSSVSRIGRFMTCTLLRRYSQMRSYSVNPVLSRVVNGYGITLSTYCNHKSQARLRTCVLLGGILSLFGFKENEEPEVITTIKRGILLIQKGELKKAEQMLHVALKIAQEQQNQDAITYVYDVLANLAFEVGEYTKAEKLFLSVMQRLLSKGVPKDDNQIIHISLKLANIYGTNKDNIRANEGFKYCHEHLKKKLDGGAEDEDTLLLFAMTLDWYARFSLEAEKYDNALSYFQKAYELSVKVNGPIHEQSVVLLNDLGTVSCLKNDYDSAIKYLTEAVNIGKQLPGMLDFASIYVNLGTVYLKKHMFTAAKEACEMAWKNAKSHNNKEGLDEASICLDEVKKYS